MPVATLVTWIAIAALPLPTIACCCSKVVPFGLLLKSPFLSSST